MGPPPRGPHAERTPLHTSAAAPAGAFDPVRVERLAVLAHHHPVWLDHLERLASPAEAAVLRRVDPRAFEADPLRGPRLLTSLLEEFPFTASLLTDVRGFLSSEAFAAAVLSRTSVAAGFASWAAGGPWVALEAAVARARRAPMGCLAPGIAVFLAPEGAVELWASARPTPADLLAAWRAPLPVGSEVPWLVEGAGITGISAELFDLLALASATAHAEALGVDPADLAELRAQRLVRRR